MKKQFLALFLLTNTLCLTTLAQPKVESIGNRFITRRFHLTETDKPFEINNGISNETFAARGEHFKLDLEINGEVREVLSSHCRFGSAEKNDGQLTLVFNEPTIGVDVAVHYAIAPDDFYMRKWLEIGCNKGEPTLLSVVVESIELAGVEPSYAGGRGKPGYVGPFFMGLEHPAGFSSKQDEGIELRHYPGKKLGRKPLRTQTAVLGAAARADAVRDQFLRYVDRIRYDHEKPLRHHIVAKLFYVGRRFNDEEYCEFIDQFKEHLYKPTGLFFNALNVWNYYLRGPGIFLWDEKKFPNGFHPLVDRLKPTDARIGFWFSLFCHEKCNTEWGREHGWEVQGDPAGDWQASRYCLAGPKYNAAVRKRLFELVEGYKPGFIHFDFNSFGCSTPGHGHLADLAHGWEANVDAEIAILEDVRNVVPDIFLMMGCGSYSSPWWLKYYDVVFGMSADSGLCDMPDPSPKSNEITRRDATFKRRFIKTDPMFPAWGYWTHEPLLNKGEFANREIRRFKLSYLTKWEDNLVMDMHRGTRVWAMHYDPTLLNEREGAWDFLAHAIRYARRNNPIMVNMKLLGGEPLKREVYGYAHWSNEGDRAIVAVRNPFVTPQTIDVKLDTSIGLKPTDKKLAVRVSYPYRRDGEKEYSYGDTMSVNLERFALQVIEIAPRALMSKPFLPGRRYSVSEGDREPAIWEEKEEAAAAAMSDVTANCEGQTITGSATVRIDNCAADLLILCETEPPLPKLPDFNMTINGEQRQGKLIGYGATAYRVKAPMPTFAWYTVPMEQGESKPKFKIIAAERFHEASVSLYLAATIPVERTPLDVRMTRKDFESQLLQPDEWKGTAMKTIASQVFKLAGSLPRMTASASSYATSNPMFVPESVIDGKPTTFWVSVGTKDQWVEVDMGEETEITGVSVSWYSPWKVKNYKIQTWDGETWVDRIVKEDEDSRADVAGPYEIIDRFDQPVKARKIRVICVDVDKGSANTSIREIKPLRVQ